ncbi:hypothetical protein [Mesorhizobium sp. WSM2239]|uniref:Uncharacterized protein n=2 Tax=unclassified Mesorhizobium TaxID=325217 RepID=A0AAU8DFT8_9HYPH
MVFEPENMHLYVEFAPSGKANWMSIDDFLARVPHDELHKQALERLLERIARAFLS